MTDTRPTNDDKSTADEGEHPVIRKATELQNGDVVKVNDRDRPITVVGRHKRKNPMKDVYGDDPEPFIVIELTGNGTMYHLVCLPGDDHAPILYTESDWNENLTGPHGQTPRYSTGEKVNYLGVCT